MSKNILRIKMLNNIEYKVLYIIMILSFFIAGMITESITGKADSIVYSIDKKLILNNSKDIIDPSIPIQEYWNNIPLPSNEISVRQIHSRIEIEGAYLSGDVLYTGSMKPTIYGGNKVIQIPYKHAYKKQDGNCPDIIEGQIISFVNHYRADSHIMHRVINNNLNNGQLYTRGDNAGMGEYVPCQDIRFINVGVLYL